MLTRTPLAVARTKMLVFLPLLLVGMLCFSRNVFSQTSTALKLQKVDDILHYNGNTIEFAPQEPPSVDTITDPQTGKTHIATSTYADPPIKLNGKEIYEGLLDKEVTKPKIKTGDKSLCNYVMHNLEPELTKLDNGDYFLIVTNVVITSKGKIVYFENDGIYKIGGGADDTQWKKEIDNKISTIINSSAISFEPARLNGKPVNYVISNTVGYANGQNIEVRDHKVKWYRIKEQ